MSIAPDRATIATAVLAALFASSIGFAVGFLTTFTHRQYAPWGLLAGLVVIGALVAGFRLVFESRVIAAAAALGAVAGTAVLMIPGAGGTAFVIGDALGYAWAAGPTLLSVAVVAWPGPRARRDAASGRSKMDA